MSELEGLAKLNSSQRFNYFCKHARCMEILSGDKYYIRVGTKIIKSDDTADLRKKFDNMITNFKRQQTRKRNK